MAGSKHQETHSKRLFEAGLESRSACGLGFVRPKYDEALNRTHARKGRACWPFLVYMDVLALLDILQA